MKYSVFLQVIFVSLLVLSQQQLYSSSMFEKLESIGEIPVDFTSDNIEVPESTCNVVDVTPMLPPGKKASDFVTRSGFLKVSGKENCALGFIFWGAMAAKGDVNKLKNYPTMIWLQGGPGASAQLGDFTEMGPIIIKGNKPGEFTFTYNEYTWATNYNMIFIDQPLGAGLSTIQSKDDIPRDQAEASVDFYQALEELYTSETGCFNVLGLTKAPLFIAGESYAGKFVPSFTSYILAQRSTSIVKQALLKGGSAVGDGFTDPKTIMDILPMFGYNLSFLSKKQRDSAQKTANYGDKLINEGHMKFAETVFYQVLGAVQTHSGIYDVYNWANTANAPEPLDLTAYLNQESVKTGIFKFPKELQYSAQSNTVFNTMLGEFMNPNVVKTVEHILEQDFPLMYYNGQNDVIVCTPCTTAWLDQIYYPGQPEFKDKPYNAWNKFDTQTRGGYFKQSQNLIFATVNNAGHMIPTDQPEAAYTMITSFVDWALARHKHNNSKQFDSENSIFNLKQQDENQYEIRE